MKVILVNGSPHANGCTDRALREVKGQLEQNGVEAEIFWIGTQNQGCLGCGKCRTLGHCVFTDDAVSRFLELAKEADGFVFGSPVYYASPAGGMVCFLDRAFYSGGSVLTNKPAATVVSCRRGGASAAFSQLNFYYTINHMPVVASQYWNQVHGNTPAEVEQDLEGLQTMRALADNMAWLLRSMEAGRAAAVAAPQREPAEKTNFIR